MNLYLLILVNRSTYNTASVRRLLCGAAVGAVVWLFPLLDWGPVVLRVLLSVLVSTWLTMHIVFRVVSLRGALRVLEKLLWYSFTLGGGVLFLQGRFLVFKENVVGIFGVMGAGGLVFLLVGKVKEHRKENVRCPVTLVSRQDGVKKTITTCGLIDSGNSLIEPISGKPVSVIDRKIFADLWEEVPLMGRAVPYRSISQKRGILQAYMVAEIYLEPEGMILKCKDVYVAVSPEDIDGMIIHPALLQCEKVNIHKCKKREICKKAEKIR